MVDHSHNSYGYTQLGVSYQGEVLRVEDKGLIYKKKRTIPWSEIYAIRTYPNFYADLTYSFFKIPQARLSIYLDDGSVLKIRGDVIKRQCGSCPKGKIINGLREDYVELVQQLRAKGIPDWKGPKEETILLRCMQLFMVVGLFTGIIYGSLQSVSFTKEFESLFIIVILSTIVTAFVGMAISPFVARKMRNKYIAAGALKEIPTKT